MSFETEPFDARLDHGDGLRKRPAPQIIKKRREFLAFRRNKLRYQTEAFHGWFVLGYDSQLD